MLTAQGSAGVDSFVIAPVGVRVALTSGSGDLEHRQGRAHRRERPRRGRHHPGPGRPRRADGAHAERRAGRTTSSAAATRTTGARRRRGRHRDRRRQATTRLLWSHGDDTDTIDGNDGTDVLKAAGSAGLDNFTVTANGLRVRIDQLNTGAALDLGTTERLELSTLGGNDTVSTTGNLAALIGILLDGGAGADTILGRTAWTRSAAATATTSWTASRATTRSSSERATTSPSGIRATGATRSRAARGRTGSPSTGATGTRSPRSWPSGSACASRATSGTSSWT